MLKFPEGETDALPSVRKVMPWGATVDTTVAEGFRVLAAIAAGVDALGTIAARLDLSEDAVASHVESLVAGGFVLRDGGGLVLSGRTEGFLDGLVGRADLLAIAAPTILELERRLGVTIEVTIPEASDPRTILGSAPYVVGEDARGRQRVLTCVIDTAGQIACALGIPVDDRTSDEIELLGKELVAAAGRISSLLPQRKDRSGFPFTRF